jgi:hypothetical protein
MSGAADLNGVLAFLLGGSNADIYLDDVKLVRLTNHIDYTGVKLFPLENVSFTEGKAPWTEYVHNDGAAARDISPRQPL